MNTAPRTERELLNLAVEQLRSKLPTAWGVEQTQLEKQKTAARIDGAVTIRSPDGQTARVFIEAKTLLNARDVPIVAERLNEILRGGDTALVVVRYVSPRVREALTGAGISFIDATGNTRVQIDAPAIFLQSEGSKNDPWRTSDRPTNSLRGRPAARVVRALADLPPPWKIRDLAKAADTSLGSTARTVDFLDREALVVRDKSGTITSVSWGAMIERWAADYDLTRERRVLRLFEPRDLSRVENVVSESGVRYVISGSLAARWHVSYAEPRVALVYTQDADLLAKRLALRQSDARSNVLLIEPRDDLVFLRTWTKEDKTYAALPQIAVDLLVGPGRNSEEGQALLRWMRDFEAEWRKR
jgi:hypothetical protein